MVKSSAVDNFNFVVSEISRRICERETTVLLRADFDDLDNTGLVDEALASIEAQQKIVSIGEGVFAKARLNTLTGELTSVDDFKSIALEALDRLGIPWEYSDGEKEYLSGESNLIPPNACVVVVGSARPALSLGDLKLRYWDETSRSWV